MTPPFRTTGTARPAASHHGYLGSGKVLVTDNQAELLPRVREARRLAEQDTLRLALWAGCERRPIAMDREEG